MPGFSEYYEEEPLGKTYNISILKRLFPYVKKYGRFLSISVVLVMMLTAIDLSLPYITKLAIDWYIVPAESKTTDQKRFLTVDINDPEKRKIVKNNPGLFISAEDSAKIDYENLSRLEKNQLQKLRKNHIDGLLRLSAIFLVLIACSLILNYVQVMIMEYTGQMIMHDLRMSLFSHIMGLSLSFFNIHSTGRLVTRVTNDVQNMYELFTSVIVFLFKDLFLLIGIAVVLIRIDWRLAIASFAVLQFVLYSAVFFSTRAREAFRTIRILIARINSRFSETIGGMEVIQTFVQEKRNLEEFSQLNHENYQAGMRMIRVFSVFMPIIELLGTSAIAVVIYYGGIGVFSDRITLGTLVAFISYLKMFIRPIRDIAEKYNIMQNALASAERIFQIMDSEEKIDAEVLESKKKPNTYTTKIDTVSEIRLEDVSLSYLKNQPVLKKINLTVSAGETIALVGPTGSGKTSLVNLLPRFYETTSGRILINGTDIRDLHLFDLRKKIALVAQDPYIFSGKLEDNIFQNRDNWTEKEKNDILKAARCYDLVQNLPEKLDTTLTEGAASLSSGERQLISIARAFSRNAQIIILDEATSYIDSETEQKVQQALYNLMKKSTTFVVAHRLSTARNADTILVLHEGEIIERGSHEKLMAKKGFYYRLNQLSN